MKLSSAAHADLLSRVSELLFYKWDPIGVNRIPACRDEYEDYVTIISTYLISDMSEIRLGDLLQYIAEEYIGVNIQKLARRKYNHRETLRILIELKSDYFLKYPELKITASDLILNNDFKEQLLWSRENR